jgi:signal transduction histidine kinase
VIKPAILKLRNLLQFPVAAAREVDLGNPGSKAVLYYYCLLSSFLLTGLAVVFISVLGRTGGWILIAPAVLLGGLSYGLRRGLSTRLSAHGVLLSGTLMAFYGAYSLGGIQSPVAFWLVLAPITAGLFLPKRDVAAWVLATVLLYSALTFKEGPADTHTQDGYAVTALITFTLVSLMAFIFTFYFKNQLIAAHQRVQRKHDHVENLLRVVSHDIANPLAIIKGTLDLFDGEGEEDPQSKKAHLTRMRRAATSIHDIIDNTRKLTALESGILMVPLEPVALLECVRNCIQDHSEALTRKSIEVQILAPEQEVRVVAERISLAHQVISNLLSNAIKFTPEGGKIMFMISVRLNTVYLRIRDTGIGIPEHLKSDLFSWGSLTNRKGTHGEAGTGFGLPIARSFVELFGGTIRVESGDKFCARGVDRPLKAVNGTEAPEASSDEEHATGTTFCIELERVA